MFTSTSAKFPLAITLPKSKYAAGSTKFPLNSAVFMSYVEEVLKMNLSFRYLKYSKILEVSLDIRCS